MKTRKPKTYTGSAPDLSVFHEIGRVNAENSIWVVFAKPGKDWQNLKVILLNGRKAKANFLIAWSTFRNGFAENVEINVMREHCPQLHDQLLRFLSEYFAHV